MLVCDHPVSKNYDKTKLAQESERSLLTITQGII